MSETPTTPVAPTSLSDKLSEVVDLYKLDDLGNTIKTTAQSTWLPALAAAVGTGGLSAYLTSRQPKRHGESKKNRRSRILTNALLAGGLTGGTIMGGAVLPDIINHKFKEDPRNSVSEKLVDTAVDVMVGPKAVPAAVGLGVGGTTLLGTNTLRKSRTALDRADYADALTADLATEHQTKLEEIKTRDKTSKAEKKVLIAQEKILFNKDKKIIDNFRDNDPAKLSNAYSKRMLNNIVPHDEYLDDLLLRTGYKENIQGRNLPKRGIKYTHYFKRPGAYGAAATALLSALFTEGARQTLVNEYMAP